MLSLPSNSPIQASKSPPQPSPSPRARTSCVLCVGAKAATCCAPTSPVRVPTRFVPWQFLTATIRFTRSLVYCPRNLSSRATPSPAAVVRTPEPGAAATIAGASATIAIPRATTTVPVAISPTRAISIAVTGTSATVPPAIRRGLVGQCEAHRVGPLLHGFMMLVPISLTLARRQTPHRRSVLGALLGTHQLTARGLGYCYACPDQRQRSSADHSCTPSIFHDWFLLHCCRESKHWVTKDRTVGRESQVHPAILGVRASITAGFSHPSTDLRICDIQELEME
jgi:hypothetical protein